MIRTLTLIGALASSAAALALVSSPATAQPGMMHGGPANGAMGDQATTDFITKAAQSDQFEIKEGRLAESRGHSAAVRSFGRKMVTAHTQTTMGLKSAIHKAGMTPPPPPALRDDQMRMMADLKGMHGKAFDAAYVDQQVHAHEDALTTMQGYSQSGSVKPIAMAATKTVPIVQSHLDMLHGMQSKMGGQ